MERRTEKTFAIALILAIALITTVSAFEITTDQITETSIIWNASSVTGNITAVSFDGITISNFDLDTEHFVQSGLNPGEWHSIRIQTDDLESKEAFAQTNSSAVDAAKTELDLLIFFWAYLVLIIALVTLGMVPKLGFIEIVASCVSIYAIVDYLSTSPDFSEINIYQIRFILYIFFVIFPYVLIYLKGGFTK
jgi:hypothetical protein